MSILSQRYGIPEATIKNMIDDGIISCSWQTYQEVIDLKAKGKSVPEISDLTKISERHIRRILNK